MAKAMSTRGLDAIMNGFALGSAGARRAAARQPNCLSVYLGGCACAGRLSRVSLFGSGSGSGAGVRSSLRWRRWELNRSLCVDDRHMRGIMSGCGGRG